MGRAATLCALALALWACGDDPEASADGGGELEVDASGSGEARTLTTPTAWTTSAEADDPWASHRPAEIACDPYAYREEDGLLEVQTEICNYLTIAQPSLARIDAGDEVGWVVWNLGLYATEPATGDVAIAIGGTPVWQGDFEIPSEAAVWDETWIADRDYPAGTTIHFHLHNHGVNDWKLLSLSAR